MVTFEDPNLIIGILGIILTVLTFYVTYKQTIGANIERRAAVRRDIVSAVSRLMAHNQLDVTPDIIQGLIRSKAREFNINFENISNPIAILEDSMTKFIENEFMSQETKKELINRVLSVQQSCLDVNKIAEESKEEDKEEIPFQILISTIVSLIIGFSSLGLLGTTFKTTNIFSFAGVLVTVISLTIILYLKILNERKKKSSENMVYSGKEFENFVYSTLVKYIGERGNIKKNYSIISETGRMFEIDILLEFTDEKIPIEIKYRKVTLPISSEAIFHLISYKNILNAKKAFIITNAQIADNAKILAEKNNITIIEKVRDSTDIINSLNLTLYSVQTHLPYPSSQ